MRNTGHLAYLADSKALEDFGITPHPYENYVKVFDNDLAKYYGQYGIADHRAIQERFLYHAGEVDTERPFDDVLKFLGHMSARNIRVFAVSGHPTHKLLGWFAEHGINVKCVYGGSRDKRACLRNACRDVRTAPEATCYVGDWGIDMQAADAVGSIPIGITRGHNTRAALIECGAEHVVDHLREFADLID